MAANALARTLKSLHAPRSPIILANVWDLASLNTILSLNTPQSSPVKAIATASWAIAAGLGVKDEELTLDQNLAAVQRIASAAQKAGLPLSVDLQDGYGDNIGDVVKKAVQSGAHGANIEDSIPAEGFAKGIEGSLYEKDDQVARLKKALDAARDAGCPDFVLNARCDVFVLSASGDLTDEMRLKEAISRGKAYLEAGATTVFYWGASRGLRDAEVKTLVEELDGKVAVKLGQCEGALSTQQLAEIGVSRISVGPSLFKIAMDAARSSALKILEGGNLDSTKWQYAS